MKTKNSKRFLLVALSALAMPLVYASSSQTLGTLATNVADSFNQIGNMMIGLAYVAGIGFGISAIFKFKQHKDNPTQIPISTPFALLGVSVLLVFLPSLYAPAGSTVFGSSGGTGGGFTGGGSSTLPGA